MGLVAGCSGSWNKSLTDLKTVIRKDFGFEALAPPPNRDWRLLSSPLWNPPLSSATVRDASTLGSRQDASAESALDPGGRLWSLCEKVRSVPLWQEELELDVVRVSNHDDVVILDA
jgi:hypothetical protein